MIRTHRDRFTEVQVIKLNRIDVFGQGICFVGCKHNRFARFAEHFGDFVVCCSDTVDGIDHKQHHIGFCKGNFDLLAHLAGNFFLGSTFGQIVVFEQQTGGVDDRKLTAVPYAVAV